MSEKRFKIRCRKNGIIVTTTPNKYDVVWKREFNPQKYTIDLPKFNKNRYYE